MTFTPTPEILKFFALLNRKIGKAGIPPHVKGDYKTVRAMLAANMLRLGDCMAPLVEAGAEHFLKVYNTTAADGANIQLRWHCKANLGSQKDLTSAIVYYHGGGLIAGSAESYDAILKSLCLATGVPVLAVDYRLAPENPHPIPVQDCFQGLEWLLEHWSELGVDPARVAVMGDSAGGGLAAAVAILCRERGIVLAKQVLIYPMLDDRNIERDEAFGNTLTWTHDMNFTAWHCLLGEKRGTDAVDPTASPSRLKDFKGLPPAYIEVGEMDIFRNEDIHYALNLWKAGISCELHVYSGVPHAFEFITPRAEPSISCSKNRLRILSNL